MLKKEDEDSEATARASIVFPLPGGPNSRRPRVGVLRPVNSSGLEIDNDVKCEINNEGWGLKDHIVACSYNYLEVAKVIKLWVKCWKIQTHTRHGHGIISNTFLVSTKMAN